VVVSTREDRLRAEPNLWFACVRSGGRPHLTPVWFVWVGDRVWIGTVVASVKARAIATNPNVMVSLESGTDPVVGSGSARISPTPYPSAVVTEFKRKYDWDISTGHDPDVGDIALVEVTVDRWLKVGGA
jgi:F420H(2)-dependent biliverdin reductase